MYEKQDRFCRSLPTPFSYASFAKKHLLFSKPDISEPHTVSVLVSLRTTFPLSSAQPPQREEWWQKVLLNWYETKKG